MQCNYTSGRIVARESRDLGADISQRMENRTLPLLRHSLTKYRKYAHQTFAKLSQSEIIQPPIHVAYCSQEAPMTKLIVAARRFEPAQNLAPLRWRRNVVELDGSVNARCCRCRTMSGKFRQSPTGLLAWRLERDLSRRFRAQHEQGFSGPRSMPGRGKLDGRQGS